jgi:hypothetical protein
LLLSGLGLILLVDVAGATIFTPFSGFADLSLVDSEVDGQDQENLRQEYSLNFDRQLSPWTHLRASLRYFKFDQEYEQLLGTYREEFQPSGEFRWDHPLAQFSVRGLRRRVVTTGEQAIITKNLQASVQSKLEDRPTLTLRYDSQRSYAEADLLDNDIVNRRYLASLDHEYGIHDLYYSYDHGVSENLISDLANISDSHTLRWQAVQAPKGRGQIQLSGNYQFFYRQLKSEVNGIGLVLEFVSPTTGLYSFNDNPILGTLQPNAGLIDGNRTTPVIPLIDIGGSGTGHNLGGDFVGTEAVAAIYVSTDRPSGTQVVWEVYGSSDNQTWEQIGPVLSQNFNLSLNRYEIQFAPASYRFFKVVNSGFNEIALVNVTEIRFLREVPEGVGAAAQPLSSSSHNMDARAGLVINEAWDTALDLALSLDENFGRGGDRNRSSLGWRLTFEPTAKIAHNVRLDGFRQATEEADNTVVETSQGYAMLLQPNPFLRGSLSLTNRLSWLGGARSQGIQSAAAQGNATLVRGLDVLLKSVVSRNQDYLSDRELRTWTVSTGTEAAVLPSLDLSLDASFQESHEMGGGLISSRLNVGGGLNWRLTRKIFLRGALRQNRDRSDRLTVDFLASWNIFRNLRLSVQHYELTDDSLTTTLRRSVSANWDLGTSTRYYARWGEVDLSGSGGTAVVSFQQGIRIGF